MPTTSKGSLMLLGSGQEAALTPQTSAHRVGQRFLVQVNIHGVWISKWYWYLIPQTPNEDGINSVINIILSRPSTALQLSTSSATTEVTVHECHTRFVNPQATSNSTGELEFGTTDSAKTTGDITSTSPARSYCGLTNPCRVDFRSRVSSILVQPWSCSPPMPSMLTRRPLAGLSTIRLVSYTQLSNLAIR